jgi:phytoene dehydrogenase-like protein
VTRRDVVVVGAGHNGLVAACYLARAGLDVEVIERDAVIGGAVSTVERWPGVRVDRGSSIHVMVRHTDLVEDLGLGALGLTYDDVEPWAVLPHPDGPIRFSHDLETTCASIGRTCGERDARAYYDFVTAWLPRATALLAAADGPPSPGRLARAARAAGAGPRHPADLIRTFLEPAEQLLARQFVDTRLRAALGWWAAQSGPPPHASGTAPHAGTVALFHLRRAGRPRGGSGRLTEALAARFLAEGGSLRTADGAASVVIGDGSASVLTTGGDRIEARAVLGACHVVETARLVGDERAAAAVRVGNGIGMAVRLLTDRLPDYRVDVPGSHIAMQFLVESPEQIRAAYGDYLRGLPASDPPMIVMTPSATDPTLAPEGRHVVTIWAQWHPRVLRDAHWGDVGERVADQLVSAVDRWAPGFAGSVLERHVQTPLELETELGLIAGNVMHVETELDAMFGLRPLPGWSRYRTPHRGLYVCGASTHPGGGVWGVSGRNAAAMILHDLRPKRGRRGRARTSS